MEFESHGTEFKEGVVSILFIKQNNIVVKTGNNPARLGAGWLPLVAVSGLSDMIFLELEHMNGTRATWILDSDAARIAGSIQELSPERREELGKVVAPIFRRLLTALIASPSVSGLESMDALAALNPAMRVELAKLAVDGDVALPPIRPALLDDSEDIVIMLAGVQTVLPKAAIARCLTDDAMDRYVQACRDGEMRFLSPVDGQEITEARGIVLGTLLVAWRCVDLRNGLVFYVLVAGFDQEVAGLYIPLTGDVIAKPRRTFTSTDVRPIAVLDLLSSHFTAYWDLARGFLSNPVRRFAHFMWPAASAHIGHYVWNELTGLDKINTRLGPELHPLVYDLGGAGGSDFLGGLGSLFPEMQGKFVRTERQIPDMLRHAYARGVQPMRFSGVRVSSGIRQRVQNLIADCEQSGPARAAAMRATGPVVVFGLRVENRTLSNLVAFFVDLAKALNVAFRGLTVIIDGHNSRPGDTEGQTFASFLERRSTRRPIDEETRVVEELRAGLAGLDIEIVDCVGMTVVDNLAWIRVADFVVAPWGAGFAKYRWLCNKPCYALASRFNQKYKSDLVIYNDTAFMDSPAPHWFVPADAVTDQPEAEVLLVMDPIHVPYYVNYTVDQTVVFPDIIKKLRDTQRIRPPRLNFEVSGDVAISNDGELFLAHGGHRLLEFNLGYRAPLDTSYRNFSANIARRVALTSGIGAKFLHIIFPDKQSVVPMVRPDPGIINLGDLYASRCEDVWRHVAYPRAELTRIEQPFLRTDTHMTAGGTLAAVAIMVRRLHEDTYDSWLIAMVQRSRGHRPYTGDLGGKLDPQQSEVKEIIQVDRDIVWNSNEIGLGNNGLVSISWNARAPHPGRLVFFGDSFSRDCCTVLAHLYREVIFLRTPYVHAEELTSLRPDIVISGNVERYLSHVENDTNAPNFHMMQWMKGPIDDSQRMWANTFSAMHDRTGAAYRRWLDERLYGSTN